MMAHTFRTVATEMEFIGGRCCGANVQTFDCMHSGCAGNFNHHHLAMSTCFCIYEVLRVKVTKRTFGAKVSNKMFGVRSDQFFFVAKWHAGHY